MTDNAYHKGNIFVTPGDLLGVIEEYIPGKGTYVEDGKIYSFIAGNLIVDKVKREAQVKPLTRQPLIPKEGDEIIGEVTNVQEKNLTLRIVQIDNKQSESSFIGVMHISDVSQGYVKTMNDAFKVGDVIRAKVTSIKNRENHLSTQDDKFGVIQAVCIYCGAPMVSQRNRSLKCPQCGEISKRKTANDYGSPIYNKTSE